MDALLIVALSIIAVYIAATIAIYGEIPISISNTYYIWREKFGFRLLFSFVMWAVGILVVIYWESKCAGRYEWLPFLSVAGMGFVGAASAYKETLTAGTHYTAAAIWAGSAIAFFALIGDWPSIVAGLLFGAACFACNRFRNLTFWAEISVVMMMFVGLKCL